MEDKGLGKKKGGKPGKASSKEDSMQHPQAVQDKLGVGLPWRRTGVSIDDDFSPAGPSWEGFEYSSVSEEGNYGPGEWGAVQPGHEWWNQCSFSGEGGCGGTATQTTSPSNGNKRVRTVHFPLSPALQDVDHLKLSRSSS